jgi:hypothetical protein
MLIRLASRRVVAERVDGVDALDEFEDQDRRYRDGRGPGSSSSTRLRTRASGAPPPRTRACCATPSSLDLLLNVVALAEIAVDKQAATLLMPVAARRQLHELPDGSLDLWTKLNIEFYKEPADAVLKALVE